MLNAPLKAVLRTQMPSSRGLLLALISLIVSTGPARAWGCAGHHIVAMIAKQHLTARALAKVTLLLESQPIDPGLARYCKDGSADSFVSSATWADDVKRAEGTGTWHYIDIPLGLTRGDLTPYCESVGPLPDGNRSGCILSAIRDQLDVLQGGTSTERARALRYVIHLVGDLHQPLHASDNGDRGGNCVPLHFGPTSIATNLHALWDSGILEGFLSENHLTEEDFARQLDNRHRGKFQEWSSKNLDVESWAWEAHRIAAQVTYRELRPRVPIEPPHATEDCSAESAKVRALNIVIGKGYEKAAMKSIDPLLTRAGYRLAAMLNKVWR